MNLLLHEVTKKFGKTTALDNVSIEFSPGKVTAIIGLNGAGKSTLLNCASGLLVPTKGEVRFDGVPFSRDQMEVRRRIMHIPDFPVVFADDTSLDHLASLARLYEIPTTGIESRVMELMKDFDVLTLAETPFSSMSRGQLYKCGLIGMIMVRPSLWLLDEPFASGMDPHGLAAFRRHAQAAAENGSTIIYSTQIIEVGQRFCDQLAVLNEGRLERVIPGADLRAAGSAGMLDELLESFRESAQ